MSPLARHLRLALTLGALALSGCATAPRHRAASVVEYLYPERRDPIVAPSIPKLTLPLRVGLAFVPSADDAGALAVVVPESERQQLMKQIADHFRRQPYVKNIETIPTAYLTPRGGFTNLEQVSRAFDVDVIALLSYDQMQFTTTSRASIAYWTLVGAYVIQGEKNDTRTLLDAAVFDVASRKLLFRAPGVSAVKGSATPIDADKALREAGARGFQLAAADLLGNLDAELASFESKVRDSQIEVQVIATPEYKARRASSGTGGGAADATLVVATAIAALGALLRRRRAFS